MLSFAPVPAERLELLCLGAHPDDIEIGAGGTILQLAASGRLAGATWIVLSGDPQRVQEGTRSANEFLRGVPSPRVAFHGFRDGYFPADFAAIKDTIEALKTVVRPDIVLAPRTDDAHQDHRLVAQLAWNAFRDAPILEYEIPKYDGDLATPNVYVPMSEATLGRKVALILDCFRSQADRSWFDAATFEGLARLRGIEAAGDERFAEAFYARKVRVGFGPSGPAGDAGGERSPDARR